MQKWPIDTKIRQKTMFYNVLYRFLDEFVFQAYVMTHAYLISYNNELNPINDPHILIRKV